MTDHYDNGFRDGYGIRRYGPREYPKTPCDEYSYRRGLEKGMRWREMWIRDEMERRSHD